MKVSLWVLVILLTAFLLVAAGYGLYMKGGIGLIILAPIVAGADLFLLRKLGILK